jgi:GNAT superfamily N-acetyltransferase
VALAAAFVEIDPARHDLKGFDCGRASMNAFLARQAMRHMRLGLSATWVLTEATSATPQPVAAYYTLCSATVQRDDLPSSKGLPPYQIPVVLLARLAVATAYQGRGLGEKTLVTALRKARALSQAGLPALGVIIGVIIEAIDEQALEFYRHVGGFTSFPGHPQRLFVPMHALEAIG